MCSQFQVMWYNILFGSDIYPCLPAFGEQAGHTARMSRQAEGEGERGGGERKMTKEDIKRIIRENRNILDNNRVKSIALFGSFVRNQQKPESDVDLLVEFKESSYDNYINLIFSLEDLLKKEVTVVTPAGLSPYIRSNVLKEAEKIEG